MDDLDRGRAYISPESIRQYNLEKAMDLVAKNYQMPAEEVDQALKGHLLHGGRGGGKNMPNPPYENYAVVDEEASGNPFTDRWAISPSESAGYEDGHVVAHLYPPRDTGPRIPFYGKKCAERAQFVCSLLNAARDAAYQASAIDPTFARFLKDGVLAAEPPKGWNEWNVPEGVAKDSWLMFRDLLNEIIVEWRELRATLPDGERPRMRAIPVEITLDPSRGVYVVLADLAADENVAVREGRALLAYREEAR